MINCRKGGTLQARPPDTGRTSLVSCPQAPTVVRLPGHHHKRGHHQDNRCTINHSPDSLLHKGLQRCMEAQLNFNAVIFTMSCPFTVFLQRSCLCSACKQGRMQLAILRGRLHTSLAHKDYWYCVGRAVCGVFYHICLLQRSRTRSSWEAAIQPLSHRQLASQLAGRSQTFPKFVIPNCLLFIFFWELSKEETKGRLKFGNALRLFCMHACACA